MIVRELAAEMYRHLATSLVDGEAVEKLVLEAVDEYRAWGRLDYDKPLCSDDVLHDDGHLRALAHADMDLTVSEWGVVRPLAELLVERENALIQEASRVAGHEVYGRSSSEIAQDIQNYRLEHLPVRAFSMMPETV